MPGPQWAEALHPNQPPVAGQRQLLLLLLEPPGVAAAAGPEQPVPVASVQWEWWWPADHPVQHLLHLREESVTIELQCCFQRLYNTNS